MSKPRSESRLPDRSARHARAVRGQDRDRRRIPAGRCRRRPRSARREVILSGGPIKTPHILELSGIGQADRLQKLGVPVVHDAPEVGENLRDHLQARITFECSQRVTLNEVLNSKWRTMLMGANYLLTRQGFMATPSATVHAQAKTRPGQTRPEVKIQIHLISGPDRYSMDPFPGFQVGFFQLRPESKGWLHAHCTRSP